MIRNRKTYILRIWREDPRAGFHCSLQAVEGEGLRIFPDMEALIATLRELAEPVEHTPPASTSDPQVTG